MNSNYRWYHMWNRPLEHDVYCGSKVVIHAGARRVDIAFRQSHLTRIDEATGKRVRLNVYRYKGKIYHA